MIAHPPAVRALLLVVVLTLCPVPASADSTSTAASDSGSRSITLPPIDVGGFVQLDYRQVFNGSERHEFLVRRARLSLAGTAVPRVSYLLGVQGGLDQSVRVIDASADVELHRTTKLRVGLYQYEFDIEGNESDELLPVIDRSWAAIAVAGSMQESFGRVLTESAFPFRDLGATVLTSAHWRGFDWGAAAGAFQGSGLGPDRDNKITYALRALVSRNGFAANYGWIHSPLEYRDIDEGLHSSWTAGIDGTWNWVRLRAEIYDGELAIITTQQERRGGYVLTVFRIHPAIDVSARWQTIWAKDTFTSLLFSYSATANAIDIAPRFHFLRSGGRTDTWATIGYMARKAEPYLADDLPPLNGGSFGGGLRSDTWRSLVVARLQVVF